MRTRRLPRSRPPIPETATRGPQGALPRGQRSGPDGSVQLSFSADVYQYVVFLRAFARRLTSTATSRATSLRHGSQGQPAAKTPSLTIRIPTSRMPQTSLRPFPARPPSRSPSMRRAPLSPSPAPPSRWWARRRFHHRGIYTTPESGSIAIPLTEVGNYTIYERGHRSTTCWMRSRSNTVVAGDCVTYTLKNEALPGLEDHQVRPPEP